MLNYIENLVKDKSVLILGFGREGASTFNILEKVKSYKSIAIADQNEIKDSPIKTIFSGKDYQNHIKDFDIVFKSPGVVLDKNIDFGNAIITSQVEIFLKVYGKQTIGITGTKGKSTTSSFIYHLLKENNVDTIFAGNIGVPVFDIIKDIKDNTAIVTELSCHQLEHCKASPKIAIFLNIYEEHLDHYDSFTSYYEAKKNIYKHQEENDLLLCSEEVKPDFGTYKANIEVIDKNILPFKNFNDIKECKLIGDHNLNNIAFAYEIAKLFNINIDQFKKSLSTFKPLPHRLELIGEKDGVYYYDDSIATAVESCIEAIKSINNINTVLIGGMDRGINYEPLIDFLLEGHVENIIFMYDSGKKIYNKIKNIISDTKNDKIKVYYCEDLKDAVVKAKLVTKKGMACSMSPASASYGYFKNFEERGDKFKEYIMN